MARWLEAEAVIIRHRRAPAVGGAQGGGPQEEWPKTLTLTLTLAENPTKGSKRETAVDEGRKEMAHRVARHQPDKEIEHD